MYKWLIPMISTALLALPAASFAADEKLAKPMTKTNMAQGKSAMAGKSDGGDKPKPEKPPKKDAMASKVGMASMAGKSDGGDKPKPEKPPKKDAVRAANAVSR